MITGSFEQACRRLFDDLPLEAILDAEMEGGSAVQIGDYTWDTEPRYIVISAYLPGAANRPEWKKYRGKMWKRQFNDLPELWEALEVENPHTVPIDLAQWWTVPFIKDCQRCFTLSREIEEHYGLFTWVTALNKHFSEVHGFELVQHRAEARTHVMRDA